MKIGFDVDGVLADFIRGFGDVARGLYGSMRVPEDFIPTDWNFGNLLTKDELDTTWKAVAGIENFWEGLQFLPSAVVLRAFAQKTSHDVWFVTSRVQGAGNTIALQTQHWMRNLGVDPYWYRGIITVDRSDAKIPIIQNVGITAFIDDYGPTVEALDQVQGVAGYLLDQPWNQDAKVKNRVKTLEDYIAAIGN